MMKKRFACLALCLVMLLAVVLTGCGNGDEDPSGDIVEQVPSQSLTMWVVSENEVSAETASAVNAALNTITRSRFKINLLVNFLTEDEYEQVLGDTIRAYEDSRNELDPSYVPPAQQTQEVVTNEKGETMFVEETETNEYGVTTTKYPAFLANQVDIIYIAGKDMYLEYINNGWLTALDSELSSSSKKIREYVSQTLLNAAKYNNSTYAIPNNNAIGEYTYMLLDKELMEKNNLDGIYNEGKIDGFFNDYVFQFLDWVRNDTTLEEDVLPVAASYDYCLNLLAHYWSINPDTYDAEENTFSFLGYHYTDAASLSRGQTILSFDSLFADDTFNENYIELNRLKFDGGYFGDLADGQRAAVQFVTGDLSDYDRYSEDYYPVIVKYPSVNVDDVYSNMFGVCSYSVDAARSMQIVTYLNTNADFRNILQYGVEGTHYQLVEQDGKEVVERLNQDYMMDIFATGNAFIAYPEPTMSQDIWEVSTQQNRQALVEPLLDFNFLDVAKESGSTSTSTPQVGTSGYTYSYTTGYSKEILSQDPILKKWIDESDAAGSGVYVLHTSSTSGQNVSGRIYYYNNSISGASVNVTDGDGAITVSYTGTEGSGAEITVISFYGRKNSSKLNWNALVNDNVVSTSVTYRNKMIDFDFMNTDGYEITFNTGLTKSMICENEAVYNWIMGCTGTDPYVATYTKQVGDKTVYTYLFYVNTISNPYTVTVQPTGDRANLKLDIRYTLDTSSQLGSSAAEYALFAITVTTDSQVQNVEFNLSVDGNSNPTVNDSVFETDPEFALCGNLDTELVRYIYRVNAKINELLNACTSVEELETLIADLKLLLTPLTAEQLLDMGSNGSDAIHTEIIDNLQVQELQDYMNSLDADKFFYAIASATSYETVNHKVYGGENGDEIEDATSNSATGEAYYYFSSPYRLYYEWLDSNGFISED